MATLKEIYDVVKSDFCNLLDYKIRGNTIEIMTGISTINQSMVSVFVSWDGNKFIASDGGWIDDDIYESPETPDEDLINRITQQYIDYYDIKITHSKTGTIYYYKTCTDFKIISSIVHDMGHFISLLVNVQNTLFTPVGTESGQQKKFQSKVNTHLRKYYGQKNVHTNHSLTLKNNKRIKLNALVQARYNQSLTQYCLMYITGIRNDLFIKDVAKATINFKIIEDTQLPLQNYQRLAIVNTLAPGYVPSASEVYLEELATFTDKKPIYLTDTNIFAALSESMPIANIVRATN